MFQSLIYECRTHLTEAKKAQQKPRQDLDERPEIGVGDAVSLPKRGAEGLKPYINPYSSRSTVGGLPKA